MPIERKTDKGLLIVVSGPSGSGKDVVAQEFIKGTDIKRIVTYTNRPKREGEVDGVDYNFVATEQFEQWIREGKFLEYVVYRKNENGQNEYKGTMGNFMEDMIVRGQDYLWRIDPTRAAQLNELFDEKAPDLCEEIKRRTVLIYIGVESLFTLMKRRMKRDAGVVERTKILENVKKDWHDWDKFESIFRRNHVLINKDGELDKTVAELAQIVESRRVAD
jgi:guanylate kinase